MTHDFVTIFSSTVGVKGERDSDVYRNYQTPGSFPSAVRLSIRPISPDAFPSPNGGFFIRAGNLESMIRPLVDHRHHHDLSCLAFAHTPPAASGSQPASPPRPRPGLIEEEPMRRDDGL